MVGRISLLFILLVVMFSGCSDDEDIEVAELSNAEQFLAEVNLARNALAAGEEEWNAYVEEVVEPVLVQFFGENFSDQLIELYGVDYYAEVKNAYTDQKLQGSSSYPSITQSDFAKIKPLEHNEDLSSGAKKWTTYFLSHEVQNLHADFSGTIDISEEEERGNAECVAPEYAKYKSARNIVVAFVVDAGVISRGHRIVLFSKEYTSGGGYFDTEVGGGTFRLSF